MTHLPAVDEFFFMNYLALGLKQKDLGHRFGVHHATMSRIVVSWANFLHCLLGAIGIWMSADRVKANLPVVFMGKHEDTQVILDCAELRCQMPSSLLLQSEVFSSYKSHFTLKGLVGIRVPVDDLVPCRVHRPAFLSGYKQMPEYQVKE